MFVIGKKNWLFSNTKSGASMSAMYYSFIESAKHNHLDIFDYLQYILDQIKDGNTNYEQLTPYAKELPKSLKVK